MPQFWKKRPFWLVILLAVLYFAAGQYSFIFTHGDSIITAGVFASEGIALAFVLLFGRNMWPGIFMGQFALAYVNDTGIGVASAIAAINAFEAVVGHMLFYRFGLDTHLKRFKDVVGLTLLIFVLQLISALPSNAILAVTGQGKVHYLQAAFSWWFGNVMGQLLFTPFILLSINGAKNIRFMELVLLGMLFGSVLFALETVWNVHNIMLLLSVTVPFIVFVVATKGFAYGTFLTIVLAMVSSFAVYENTGPFYHEEILTNVINYNLFVLAHISTVFVTGVLFEERKRYEVTLHEMVQEGIEKNKEQQLLMFQQSRQAQMGEMIGMIAHQWRQPLHSLSLMHEILAGKFDRDRLQKEDMTRFREHTKKQIEFMAHTIDDFRDFFRSQKEKRDFSLNETVKGVLRMIAPALEQLGIDVALHAPREYRVYGHGNTLAQVVLNLINNAKDALQECDAMNKRIDIELNEHGEEVRLCVRDNGGGISDEALDKLFEPYFSTKTEKGGTGLGLYMSKLIIEEQFEGKIVARNEGDGACFEIVLKTVNNEE